MLVIGNGESRENIDLNKINTTKVGCNAIMRDFFVDHLICVDRRMVEESISFGINSSTIVYTRKDWISNFASTKNITTVPELLKEGNERWDEPFQWGSGPYAVLLSATLVLNNTVKLIGFDLYSENNCINNIYKNTNNYDNKKVDPRYWIHQISKVFEWFPKINFKIYQKENWILPESWKKPNVSVDNVNNL